MLSSKDSLSLAVTFLKGRTLNTVLKQLSLKRFRKISGALQEWKMPIPGFKLLAKYQDLVKSKDIVLSMMFISQDNELLYGSKTVAWRYWENGKPKDFLGTFTYQKFKDEWILMQKSVFDRRTYKSVLH